MNRKESLPTVHVPTLLSPCFPLSSSEGKKPSKLKKSSWLTSPHISNSLVSCCLSESSFAWRELKKLECTEALILLSWPTLGEPKQQDHKKRCTDEADTDREGVISDIKICRETEKQRKYVVEDFGHDVGPWR